MPVDEEAVRKAAGDLGLPLEIVHPESIQDLRNRIRELLREGNRRIAVGGGDGTISEAVQEVAHTDAVLGILPMGTRNNFATALKLPMELPAALEVLLRGEERAVGLGKVHERYFTEGAGIGLFAEALARHDVSRKKNIFRGIYATLQVLLTYRALGLRITVDGQRHTERAVMCTVANSFRLGAGIPIAPTAELGDDVLDVVLVGDLDLCEVLHYFRAVTNQQHLGLPKVTTLRGREVVLESRLPLHVHADDQVVGHTPVKITSHPEALRVMLPRG